MLMSIGGGMSGVGGWKGWWTDVVAHRCAPRLETRLAASAEPCQSEAVDDRRRKAAGDDSKDESNEQAPSLVTHAPEAHGRRHIFLDEAGNLDFSGKPGASRYFIITSVVLEDCAVDDALLALRRELAWASLVLEDGFHAAEDRQLVRDRVFKLLHDHPFRVDATVVHKANVHAHLQADPLRFYRVAVYKHLARVTRSLQDTPELHVTCAALGTRPERQAHIEGVEDTLRTTRRNRAWRIAMWPAASDPCLQVADYCCWAIQRRWERGDDRSHALIHDKILSEVELFVTPETRRKRA